jgi:hypothetical protein
MDLSEMENFYEGLQSEMTGIPPAMVFNLNETGDQNCADRKDIRIMVPALYEGRSIHVRCDRSLKRASLLACIAADGIFCSEWLSFLATPWNKNFMRSVPLLTASYWNIRRMILLPHNFLIRSSKMAKKSQLKSPFSLVPPLPVDALTWQILPRKASVRSPRLISRHIADFLSDSRREQIYKIPEILANRLQIFVTDLELISIVPLWSEALMVSRHDS